MARRADLWAISFFALNLFFLSAIWLNEREEESLRVEVSRLEEVIGKLELQLAEEVSFQYARLQAVRQEAALATSRAHGVEVELEVLQLLIKEMRDGHPAKR